MNEITKEKIDGSDEKTDNEINEDIIETDESLNTDAKNSEEETDKKEKYKKERIGILYIYASQNNTILTLTDMAGNTISRSSGGQSTKQDRLKSSPTVAMFAAKKISEEAKEIGIHGFYVRIKAETGSESPGNASHAVVKSLSREGFKIISITDITGQPRGGPKKPHGRRGRRV